MRTINQPGRCPFCNYYLTTAAQFASDRCVDPGHWQATGLLAPRDYYLLAKIAARANEELNQRPANGDARSRRDAAEPKVGSGMLPGMKGGGDVYDCLNKSP
jgi:hypothetical protein